MKKILFIDRDGTLIKEPISDFQIDSLEKLEFIPNVFQGLTNIVRHLDYQLVMVTNQDGLGTASFPEDTFGPAQNKMLAFLANEGIVFSNIHIDKSFEDENLPTRKPSTGMLTSYFSGEYDLTNSFVIGDRMTDVLMAKKLGAKAILFKNDLTKDTESIDLITEDWNQIYSYLRKLNRKAIIQRKTNETDIFIDLSIEGTGKSDIKTGLVFLDHMLDQLVKHSGADLIIKVNGDLEVDEHHTIEDTAIALGEAYLKALTDKRGMMRYGFTLPMDDCLAQVAIDFGGRSWLVWEAEFNREMIGDVPTEMFHHFFKSFTDASKSNLNIKVEGQNEHHKIESIFKAFAKAIKMAVKIDENNLQLPSTKGVL